MPSVPSPATGEPRPQSAEAASNSRSHLPALAQRDWGTFKIVVAYILLSGLWIILSDQVAIWIAPDPATFLTIETLKGWVYTLAAALLLYGLIRRHTTRLLDTRTQAEAALRLAEEKYRSIVENTVEGIFQTTPDGRYLFANPALARIYGYDSPDDLIATIHDIGQETYFDSTRRTEFIRLLEADGEVHDFENRMYRKDGSVIWIRSNAHAVRDETGAIRYYEGTAEDITDRKHIEEALRESSEFNRLIIASMQAGIIVVDRSLRCLMWNPFMEQLTGLRANEVLGKRPLEFFPGWQAQGNYLLIDRALAGETVVSTDFSYKFPAADRTVWVWYKIGPVRDAQGEVIGVIVIVYDITQRKRAEQFEHDQRVLAEALRNTAEAITGTLDLEEILDRILENVERVVPLDTADLMLREGDVFRMVRSRGYEPYISFAGDSLQSFPLKDFALLQRIVTTGRPLVIEDAQHDPSWVILRGYEWIRSQLGAPILINSEVIGVIELQSDQPGFYTALHAARLQAFADQAAAALQNSQLLAESDRRAEQLRTSREQLRALSGHLQSVREEERTAIAREIHDDLGQALTGLQMDVAWLQKQAAVSRNRSRVPSKLREMSSLIDTTIQSVRRIATQLRPGILDDLGLAAAIEWQLQDFQRRTGIQCEMVSTLEDLPLDDRHATAMFRIFQETLANVARHAKARRVEVQLRLDDHSVLLAVKDDGQGIAPQAIYDPRSLGLLGMRERAALVGGEINVDGETGAGTVVTLRIPVEEI